MCELLTFGIARKWLLTDNSLNLGLSGMSQVGQPPSFYNLKMRSTLWTFGITGMVCDCFSKQEYEFGISVTALGKPITISTLQMVDAHVAYEYIPRFALCRKHALLSEH